MSEGARPHGAMGVGTVELLRKRAEEVLRPLLADVERYALIDFPHYPNVGDSAIFLGQLAGLHALGLGRPAYVCDLRSYDAAMLRRCLDGGTILLAGGGGFGDLWPLSQELRERIASDFVDNPIVQLPQSIHFRDAAALERARHVLGAHPRFTLLAREDRSLELARRFFDAHAGLCPDMAFFLGRLDRPAPPSQRVVLLARTDQEAAGDDWPSGSSGFRTDWLEEPSSWRRAAADHLIGLVRRRPTSRVLRRCLSSLYPGLARERLERGCTILSRGRVVITDRLHGHVLSLLLGIPHVVLDNSYGKLSSFHRTWTAGCEQVRWAETKADALRRAEELLGSLHERDDGLRTAAGASGPWP